MATTDEWEIISEPSRDNVQSSDDGEWEIIGGHAGSSPIAPPIRLSGEQQAIIDRDNPVAVSNAWMGGRGPEDSAWQDVKDAVNIPLGDAGDVFRASATDAVAGITGAITGKLPWNSGNLYEKFSGNEMPVDIQNRELSETNPGIATLGKVGQGVLGSAPLLVAGAGLGPIGQRLLALGFSAHMIAGAPKAAEELGTELGKNPQDQDKDKITSLSSELIQVGAFAPLAGAHGLKPGAPKPATKFKVEPREFKSSVEGVKTEVAPAKTQAEVAAELGLPQPAPQPDWQVSVQAKAGDVPGFVQIVDPKAPSESAQSPTMESLRAAGYHVPDFSKLPQGKYTYGEAVTKATQMEAHGGGESTLTHEQRTQSRQNNSQEAFLKLQAEADAKKVAGQTTPPTQPAISATTPITQPAGGAAPPVIPPATPPAVPPTPAPGRGPVTLNDIYSIFEPAPKAKVSLGQRVSNVVEAVRTGVSSKFRPINKLAEDIAKAYGTTKKDIAGIFEQLKGSSGKGEADIYRFDKDVSDLVSGSEKDFSPYMFLRRSLDRLNQDAADVAAGLPERRKVSAYTIPDLQAKLQQLEANLGPDKVAKFQAAADAYQVHMDQALQLQVDSGRMSPQVYQAIKDGNQFYAPFKVMKYIEETSRPAGSGKKIDTVADFTKAMEGIESADFKLGDMLGAARQNILLSRILAEKNRAMQNITQLAAIDTNAQFVAKLKAGQDAPKGMEAVNVLEGGKEVRYAVNPDVAQAIQLYGENGGGVISSLLSKMSVPFRAGATAFNLPFQVSNLLADVPRQALVSRYGTRGVSDLIRYPLDFLDSAFSNILGEMVGYRNKLMLDFLDSGVAGATIQEHLTPKALRTETVSLPKKFASGVLYSIPNFAKAIEQTSKTVGVKRAMRFEGVQSGAQLAKQIPEAITEIRRFSGSPDFGRTGKWTEQARLNLLYMFLNARIQGTIADVGRLTGRDGAGTAAKTWAKILPAVGLPTLYAYLNNTSGKTIVLIT